MEIGFIGTGIMGAPMARRLMRAGHRLRVFNRTPEKARALTADGASLAADAAGAATGAEAVFINVPDTPDVKAVAAQIEPSLSTGALVLDMSTVAPQAEREIAARLKKAGIDYLDAPVSGGESGAIEGALTIMVGGESAACERAMPLLGVLGRRITYMGPSGAGQMTKLANQIVVSLNLLAAAEGLKFAVNGGLDAERVLQAIGAGAAASWQLQNLGPKIVARDFRPGFFVKLLRKDLRLVAEVAADGGLALPGLKLTTSLFNTAAALGHDLDGTQALAATLDSLSRVQ